MPDLPESGSLTPGAAALEARLTELEQENARLSAELAELRAARQLDGQIRKVADALPVLVSFIDAERRYRYNNKAYEKWLGRPRRELFGRRVGEVLGEAAVEAFRPLADAALAGERVSAERSFRDSNGVERHLQVDYVPAKDGDGKVLGFYSLVRDISASKRSEAALRETERRLDAVLNNTRMAVFLMDHRQHCIYANAAAEQLTGYSFAEMQGRPLHDVIHHKHPDGRDYPLDQCPIDRAFPEDNHVEGEEVFVHKDGSFYPVAFTASPVRDEASRTVGTIVEVRGIAEEKAREAALRESEARFRSMADCAPVPVWVTGPTGIEFVNRAFVEVAGVPADQLNGETWMKLIHPDDLPPVLEERARAWAEARAYRYEARFRRHDGERRWMQVSCNPRFDEEERLIGYVGLAVDVTESRHAEQELRAEGRILATLNRVGASLAGELDLERVVQMVTDAGVELTGAQFGAFFYNVLNAAGESYMLYTIAGVDRSEFDKFPMPRNTHVFAPTFGGEGVVRSDDITRDERYGRMAPHHGMPKGHLPVTSYLAVPVTSRSGEVIGGLFFGHAEPARFTARHEELLVGIAGQAAVAIDNARLFEAAQREIAERRRAEEALRELNLSLEARIEAAIAERERAEEALRQAQKMEAVGQLTGGIAHDFNNLLTVISGNLDLAARRLGPNSDPKVARAIGSASIGAERAATLTQRLLAFSRRQPLAPKTIDPNALLAGMTDLLHRTLGETIQVETRLAGGLGRIEADPHQLESAILNLAVNARDAMPDGGRLVIETAPARLGPGTAAQGDEISPGKYVVISVSDSGVGMNEETAKRAVEPFFTTKEVGKGTGLGLSMVYGFVRQSGGHLDIESEEGRGTRVNIYLPRMSGEPREEEQAEAASVPRSGGDETILVCEDDDDVRAYTLELLGELGYRVLEASDGPATLRLLRDSGTRVDLLFTDVVLPGGMSGAELADQARGIRPDLRILFTTGYARDAIVHDGRLDPGVELVAKPFSFAELAARIRTVLDRD